MQPPQLPQPPAEDPATRPGALSGPCGHACGKARKPLGLSVQERAQWTAEEVGRRGLAEA
ncbi:hypothetical protein SAV14893_082570 [Streptomyces avermitilis]|uniref:Uncharacterized protein n=1 Tax=Streptomyces avermitilis TaxID=33903 RepID=A0A4D4MAN7_STRAX|nr:hypothetical protein SAV14893_082570 [Streptomyces avermitilis]GDY70754.1 hypothetical protein SAV31267_002390 [Streptomyces avermitilis]